MLPPRSARPELSCVQLQVLQPVPVRTPMLASPIVIPDNLTLLDVPAHWRRSPEDAPVTLIIAGVLVARDGGRGRG